MERRWIGSTDFDQDKSITVLQWNILSQSLGENGDFALCPEEALQSGHRNSLIFDELFRIKADILCLEEVDCFSHLSYVLEDQGYAGIWTPKPDSPCLKFENNIGPDGNALFFLREKFELKKTYHKVLSKEDGNPTNSTALVCQLFHKLTGKFLTILVTHLKAKETPEFVEIRKQQAECLVKLVREIQSEWCAPLILAGDFNATPDEPAYKILCDAHLQSAYEELCGEEPDYTTWKIRGERGNASSPVGEKKRTIDFLFYLPGMMKAMAVLELPSEEDIGPNRLPNLKFPSDHMYLVAKFEAFIQDTAF